MTASPQPQLPQWKRLIDHVLSVPERVYEHWGRHGWDNNTDFGREYGGNLASWCVIFEWVMYHDVGLDAAVPKTDNVTDFSNWARAKGLWTQYPSIGAWVNLGDGAHTEIVTGFDATHVFTKGGNSLKSGAADGGQGNGVWSHRQPRRAERVTGYFAPRFPDGVCPPTADPDDPRGGKPVTAYSAHEAHPASAAAPAFPGRRFFVLGAASDHALRLQTWLHRGDWGPPYRVGPGRTMTALDLTKVRALQEHYEALHPADGLTGPLTWQYAYEVAYGLRAR